MAEPVDQAPAMAADTVAWLTVRQAYRLALQAAMASPATSGGSTTGTSECGPTVGYPCNAINDAFTSVNANNPENQPGSWPLTEGLNGEIAGAFSGQKPASTTIPLQLQANTLESYRRTLLHKKWRKCQHLQAVNASLVDEQRSQSEIQRLLLAQQVGNSGRPAT